MNENNFGLREKSSEELRKQITDVASMETQSIVPPTLSLNKILEMPESELKKTFSRRYELYVSMLRAQRRGVELSSNEKHQFAVWVSALNHLDGYIARHHTDESQRTLRENQMTAFEDLRRFLEAGGTEGYIKLPTGIGKTVIFSEFIEATGLRTLIVVPKKLLLHQTEQELEQFAEDIDVGKVYGEAKQYGRTVTLITYESLVRQIAADKLDPNDYDCLVLDEAHVALTDARVGAVRKFPHALKIGFTATPKYSEEKQLRNLLPHEIHALHVREAIEQGSLSPVSVILIKTKVDLSSIPILASGELSQAEAEKKLNVPTRNKAAVKLYKEWFDGELAVAYCLGVAHAQALAKTFNDAGVPAASVSGVGSHSEEIAQQQTFEQYAAGKIKVLCSADLLIAGFNQKKASVAFNLRPMISTVAVEQRGGRVLRLDPARPDKHAYVLDFIDQTSALNAPLSFADILGAAEAPHRVSSNRFGNGGHISGGSQSLPAIDLGDIEVITEADQVMKVVNKTRADREAASSERGVEAVPESWATLAEFFDDLDCEELIAQIVVNALRANPTMVNEFGKFKDPLLGQRQNYFSPTFIQYAIEQRKQYGPRGWQTVAAFIRDMKATKSEAEPLITGLRSQKPALFGYFKMASHSDKYLYLSPEAIEVIRAQIEEIHRRLPPRVPKDWLGVSRIQEGLFPSANENEVENYIEEAAAALGLPIDEVFGTFNRGGGKLSQYCDRRLLSELAKRSSRLSSLNKAPADWLPREKLVDEIGVSLSEFRSVLDSFRTKDPETRYFSGWQPEISSEVRELDGTIYLSPAFIEILKKKLGR